MKQGKVIGHRPTLEERESYWHSLLMLKDLMRGAPELRQNAKSPEAFDEGFERTKGAYKRILTEYVANDNQPKSKAA